MDDSLTQDANDKTKTGVYYQDTDYAGLFRRIVIVVIDLSVIFLSMIILNICWFVFVSVPLPPLFLIWLAITYFYLAILKRTRIRTLGYILTGVEIVDLKGKCPSWLTMTTRYISLVLGLLHPLLDILWLTQEREKQTLRDKVAGTYVIKKNAQPVGTGIQIVIIYHVLGFALSLPELRRDV